MNGEWEGRSLSGSSVRQDRAEAKNVSGVATDACLASLLGVLLSALAIFPVLAESNVPMMQGRGYPACVAISRALRKMPATTDLMNWPEFLPAMRGIAQPVWTQLDVSQHMQDIRAFMIKHKMQNMDKRGEDVIWRDIGPKIELDVKSNRLRLEETVVHGVKIGATANGLSSPLWTTDIRFVRVGRYAPTAAGTISQPNQFNSGRMIWYWQYEAAWFSLFPDIHHDLIDNGNPGRYLILVVGQPWFISVPGTMGIPYTNDLASTSDQEDHQIYVDQRCMIAFPWRFISPERK